MEATGVVDPDNEADLMVLHCLYLPRINHSLEEFTSAWNRHPLRNVKVWFNSRMSMDDGDNERNVPDLE